MTEAPSTRYARADSLRLKRSGDQLAVYVPTSKALYVLNPTAEVLFGRLEEPATLDELVATLTRATDGDEETIREDLQEVLADFEEAGLIDRRT